MRVDLGKVDENRKSREESINAPVSALLCKLAREPCVNTLTQAAAHFCPQIGSTWLNMVFHFKEVLHKTTLAMDTIYFAFSGANCATLAHRHTGTLAHWHTGTGTGTGTGTVPSLEFNQNQNPALNCSFPALPAEHVGCETTLPVFANWCCWSWVGYRVLRGRLPDRDQFIPRIHGSH